MSPTLPTPLLFLSFLVPDSDGQVIPFCGPRSPFCNVGQGSQTSATLPLSGLCLAHCTAVPVPELPAGPPGAGAGGFGSGIGGPRGWRCWSEAGPGEPRCSFPGALLKPTQPTSSPAGWGLDSPGLSPHGEQSGLRFSPPQGGRTALLVPPDSSVRAGEPLRCPGGEEMRNF